jgi:hypothetical protein
MSRALPERNLNSIWSTQTENSSHMDSFPRGVLCIVLTDDDRVILHYSANASEGEKKIWIQFYVESTICSQFFPFP